MILFFLICFAGGLFGPNTENPPKTCNFVKIVRFEGETRRWKRLGPREYYRNIERVFHINDDILALIRWEVYRDF